MTIYRCGQGLNGNPIKAVLFDVDDTLIDVASGIEYGVRKTLVDMGFAYSERLKEQLLDAATKRIGKARRLYELRVLLSLREVLGSNPFKTLEFAARMVVWIDKVRTVLAQPVEGAPETLMHLKDKGYRLGVVSDMPASKFKALALRLRFLDELDVCVTRSDVAKTKPSPEGILLALNRMGLNPAQAVYVGNMPSDVEAGRRAGVRTVYYPGKLEDYFSKRSSECRADYVIKRISQLTDLL